MLEYSSLLPKMSTDDWEGGEEEEEGICCASTPAGGCASTPAGGRSVVIGDDHYCAICDMWLRKKHVEDHLTGEMHRGNSTGGQQHIGTASGPASSSEIAVQAGQGESVRVALLSLAGEEVGAINVAPDSGWREVAVEVRLQIRNFQALPPADVRAATGASMAAEGVQVIRRAATGASMAD